MSDFLVEVLYRIASGLLLPVLLTLVVLTAATLLALGGLLREVRERRAAAAGWRRFLADLRAGGQKAPGRLFPFEFYELPLNGYVGRFREETALLHDNPLGMQKCLDDLEIDITRRLAQLALATRVGPMLGLVGTLIPLGPALTGLATGHMEVLAGNLIIAFTTTVFGILIGGFAYAISLVRRTWYEQDLSDLEFLVAVNRAAQRQPDAPCLTEEPDLA
jgi:biopolymer transport protein ExbB/TolQ